MLAFSEASGCLDMSLKTVVCATFNLNACLSAASGPSLRLMKLSEDLREEYEWLSFLFGLCTAV